LAVKKRRVLMRKERTQELEFVQDLPRKRGNVGKWMNILMPLLKKPNQWALIWTAESPQQANKLQSNLHARMLLIPEPEHIWQFSARGQEVYAVYRGRRRGQDASVRNSNRRR
jgi:hypothetical protein